MLLFKCYGVDPNRDANVLSGPILPEREQVSRKPEKRSRQIHFGENNMEFCKLCKIKTRMVKDGEKMVCPECHSESWMEDGNIVFVPKGLRWQAARAGMFVPDDEEVC